VTARIGVDLLAVHDLDRLLGRRWFDRFVYTEAELAAGGAMARTRGREFLAGRFAAKEAVLKVLGRGLFQGVVPRDIGLVRDSSGGVAVSLRGSALARADLAGLSAISVSITHKGGLVCAMAIGWCPDETLP
jgi:holo-[acyl-carrier protein] synthase